MLETEIATSLEALAPVRDEWDALAVAARMPLAAPAVVEGWWRHLARPGTELRAIVVREDGRLVGLGQWYAEPPGRLGRRDLRLVGAGTLLRIAPLAAPGREWEVAEALARALAGLDAHLVALEGLPAASPWPVLLRERWPGAIRPVRYQTSVQGAPSVTLAAPDLDAWLAGRSANFRAQMRRMRRRLAEAGGAARLSDAETLRADLEAFARLHVARWEGRGGSHVPVAGTALVDALEEIGRALLADGRFRLWMLELGGEAIAAQVFVAAGGELCYWNGGWDERHAKLKPAQLAILAAVEHALAAGDERLDLGAGEQAYKLRFADGGDALVWGGLLVPGRRLPLTLASYGPQIARYGARSALRRALGADRLERLKTLARRAGVR